MICVSKIHTAPRTRLCFHFVIWDHDYINRGTTTKKMHNKRKNCYCFIKQKGSSISKTKCLNPTVGLRMTRKWNLSILKLLITSTNTYFLVKLKCNLPPYIDNKQFRSHMREKRTPECTTAAEERVLNCMLAYSAPNPSCGIINWTHKQVSISRT